MSTPMIIPIHTGGHGNLTPEGVKVLVGVWILINAIWLVSLLYGFIPAIKRRRIRKKDKFLYKGFNDTTNILKCWWHERSYSMVEVFDVIMLCCWGFIALIYLGFQISKFI